MICELWVFALTYTLALDKPTYVELIGHNDADL